MLEAFCFSVSIGLWAMWQFALKPNPPSPWWWRWIARPLAVGALAGSFTAGLWVGSLTPVGWLFLPVILWVQGAGVWALIDFMGWWPSGRHTAGGDEHRRGTEILDAPTLTRFMQKRYGKPGADDIQLGGVPVPPELETMHFLLAGSTGSGKSVALTAMMVAARNRGHRAIVADPGGAFTSKFFNNENADLVFNPFDQRGFDWSPLAEIRQQYDCGRVAESIIPEGAGGDKEWNGFARNVLTCILETVWESGGDNREIVRLLFTAEQDSMAEMVAGTPASRMYQKGNERMLGSVLGIISRYTAPLRWLNPAAGRDAFSVRNWIEQEGQNWLFLPFRDDQLAQLRPLLAAVLDIAASATLSLPPDASRRIWYFLDEFATLGEINGIEPLLTKARKNGGAVVVGIQALAQLQETYGREKASTLLSCLSSVLVLRQTDGELAEHMSRFLGEQEVLRTSRSGGTSSSGSTDNWSQQIARQRAVLPAELGDLPPRHGFLDLVGDIPACRVELPIIKLADRAPALVEKQAVAINPARDQQQPPPNRRDDKEPPAPEAGYELP